MNQEKSNSSGNVSGIDRLRYLIDLFMMRWRGRGRFDNCRNIARIREYRDIAARHGIDLNASQILEIGVGQRPYLGITFLGYGCNYTGVDLDQPVYPPSFSKFLRLYRINGGVRLIKTVVRYFLFDRPEYLSLFESLGLEPARVRLSGVFVQANAASLDLDSLFACSADKCTLSSPLVVVSESVFEHIPRSDLRQILHNLRTHSVRCGRRLLVLTRPTIFTGICGSHLTEWYHHNVYSTLPKRSEPWEHLRKNRFAADTYLNRMTREDYRDCFCSSGFEIVRETVEHPGLGGEFLKDAALREELAEWSDDELLSNEVMFELIPAKDMSV